MVEVKKKKQKKKGKPAPRATTPVLNDTARPARPLFRLLPLTILTAFCLFTLKVVEIVETGKNLGEALFVETVQASQEKEAPKEEAPKEEAEHAAAGEAQGEKEKKELPEGVSNTPPAPTPAGQGMDVPEDPSYNAREVIVLEALSERRTKIENMERQLGLREKVLQATEQRIDEKLAELSRLNTEVKDMLVVKNKEDEAQMGSLVKIYEAMKPKEAARIFNEMDMNTLLMVASKMSERRLAPVLAAMTPDKARDVTVQLADQQRSRKATLDMSQKEVNSPPL